MSNDDIAARLAGVIRDVLDAPGIDIHDGLTAADVDGWDSVAQIELIFAVEAEFGITFPAEDIASFADVGEMRQYVAGHLDTAGG